MFGLKWKTIFYIQVKVDARLQEVSKRISLENKKNFEIITKNIEKQLNTDSKSY